MEYSRGKVSIPMGTNDPSRGTPFSFAWLADARALANNGMFTREERIEIVGGKQDPEGRV